jgi:invasion protein IalB
MPVDTKRAVNGTNKGLFAMVYWIATARPLGWAPTATLAGTLTVLFLAAPALAQQLPAQKQALLMSLPWMKVCNKGSDTNNKQVCVITKESLFGNGRALTTVQLFEPEGGQKFLRVTVPLGVQLSYGTRILIDQSWPAQSPYNMCFPIGCASDYQVTDDLIAKMKKGQNIIVEAIDMQNTTVSLPVPLNDFAKAYAGPPTDPKVFSEQQRKLQEEMQKQSKSQEEQQKEAEENRKKLEGPTQAPAAALAPAQKK